MHILYVDESGDDGFSSTGKYESNKTPTRYYIKTGLAIHDLKWHGINQAIENFKYSYRIPAHIELHSTGILSGTSRSYINGKPKYYANWFGKTYPKRKDRFDVLLKACELIKTLNLSLFYILIDKSKIKTTVANYKDFPKLKSWEFLIERYNLYLTNQVDKKGIIICDAITNTIEKEQRKFAQAIYTNSFHVQRYHFIESILFEPSESSNILQLVDIAAFAAGRKYNSSENVLFDTLKDKIFPYNGIVDGCGFKEWPD